MNFNDFKEVDLEDAKLEVRCSRMLIQMIDIHMDKGEYDLAYQRQQDLNRSLKRLNDMRANKKVQDQLKQFAENMQAHGIQVHHFHYETNIKK